MMIAATISKNLLRYGLCGVAVWVAFHSVSIGDALTLKHGEILTGTISKTPPVATELPVCAVLARAAA